MVDASAKYMNNQPQSHLSSPILGNTQGLPKMILNYGGLEVLKDDLICKPLSNPSCLNLKNKFRSKFAGSVR